MNVALFTGWVLGTRPDYNVSISMDLKDLSSATKDTDLIDVKFRGRLAGPGRDSLPGNSTLVSQAILRDPRSSRKSHI